jgi:hypothetical protein
MTGYGNLAYLNRLERALKHLERLGIDARGGLLASPRVGSPFGIYWRQR